MRRAEFFLQLPNSLLGLLVCFLLPLEIIKVAEEEFAILG